MFADDSNLFFTEKWYNSAFRVANQELKLVDNWLLSNKLSLNINKTSYIVLLHRKLATFRSSDITPYQRSSCRLLKIFC